MTIRAIDDTDFLHRRRLELELERRKVGGECACFIVNTTDAMRIDPGCCVRHRPGAPASPPAEIYDNGCCVLPLPARVLP